MSPLHQAGHAIHCHPPTNHNTTNNHNYNGRFNAPNVIHGHLTSTALMGQCWQVAPGSRMGRIGNGAGAAWRWNRHHQNTPLTMAPGHTHKRWEPNPRNANRGNANNQLNSRHRRNGVRRLGNGTLTGNRGKSNAGSRAGVNRRSSFRGSISNQGNPTRSRVVQPSERPLNVQVTNVGNVTLGNCHRNRCWQ